LKSARNSKSLFLSNFAVLPVQLEPATWKFWLVWRDVLKTSGSRILNYAHSSFKWRGGRCGTKFLYHSSVLCAILCFTYETKLSMANFFQNGRSHYQPTPYEISRVLLLGAWNLAWTSALVLD